MKEWEKSNSFFDAFKNAWSGFISAYKEESNIRRQIMVFFVACVTALVLQISIFEFMILIGISALVITLELVNTALERLEDLIHPEYHSAIKYSKDAAAAAVLVASVAAVAIGLLIFLPPILRVIV